MTCIIFLIAGKTYFISFFAGVSRSHGLYQILGSVSLICSGLNRLLPIICPLSKILFLYLYCFLHELLQAMALFWIWLNSLFYSTSSKWTRLCRFWKIGVPCNREKRIGGEGNYMGFAEMFRMIKLAAASILTVSKFSLRLTFYILNSCLLSPTYPIDLSYKNTYNI